MRYGLPLCSLLVDIKGLSWCDSTRLELPAARLQHCPLKLGHDFTATVSLWNIATYILAIVEQSYY